MTRESWRIPGGLPEGTRVVSLPEREGFPALHYPVLGRRGVREVLARLARARNEELLHRPVESLPGLLGRVGRRFLDTADPLRREALELLPDAAGLSSEMSREVLDGMARDWTPERLAALLRREFADPQVLDRFRSADGSGSALARSPPVTLHVGSGNVPGVTVTSLLRSLLVKSAALVKPGRGDILLPLLFHRGLEEEDEHLARTLAVAYWPGGDEEMVETEGVLFASVTQVVAYGSDVTLREIRERLSEGARLIAYPHRWSVGVVAREMLDEASAEASARAAARSVALFEQRGCVSPQAFYVERGGGVEPRSWARRLAAELERLTRSLPPPPLLLDEAARIQQTRGAAALRAAAGRGVEVHEGGALSWTVIFDPENSGEASCLGRMARVHPIGDLRELPRLLSCHTPSLQTVALEAKGVRREQFAKELADIGALRITTLAGMPWPPAWWHHDGMAPLGSLIRWVDLEG